MDLQQYVRIVRRYWRSAVGVFLACLAAAAGVTLLQAPVYASTASLFLVVQSGDSAGELSQGATYAERQVKSYVDVATSTIVLEPVVKTLDLDMTPRELGGKMKVSSPPATSIIDVTASDTDPSRAMQMADGVAKQLVRAVDDLSPAGADGAKLVSANVIDPARPPLTPTSPRPALNLALGAILGLLLGLGQALLRNSMDLRVRTPTDVSNLTPTPVLAAIGRNAPGARAGSGQQWANDEAYRRLRTNIGFVGLGGERRNSIVMTSSVASEGKTETVTNLARVLAEAGERVILVDADLRRPQVSARLGLDGELGLSDVLTARGELHDLVVPGATEGLWILPAGTVPPNPSELLGSDAMGALIKRLEGEYDHVLFDTPPLLPVTDAAVLASRTGGAILVARSGRVRRPQMEAALELLHTGAVAVLGVVLNDVQQTSAGTYGDYYSSYSSYAPESVKGRKRRRRAA